MFDSVGMFKSLLKKILNNRGEVPVTPSHQPATPATPATPAPQPQPSAYDTLIQKKGFKSNDDVARSYEEVERSYGKSKTSYDTTKKQLEQHGYSLDDNGNIIQVNPNAQPPVRDNQYQQYGQPNQPYQQQQETIYDPYTGQVISNPIDMQLAQLPLSQRTAVVVNAIIAQRDQFTTAANGFASEVLSKPEAKGFEEDVRKVMAQMPIEQRAKKESWEDALLRVKGMKYDEAMKNAGRQGVDNFLNKQNSQQIPGAPGAGDNVKLTEEQETTFKWYQQNKPGMFKDKAHFVKSLLPTMGR